MIIYRMLDKDGDYVLGRGTSEFLSGSSAIAQAIVTHLKLLLGEWWENVNLGTPLFQSVLGKPGSEEHLASVDNIYKAKILSTELNGTPLIHSLDNYERDYNPSTRIYKFRATVTTIYSESVIIEQELSIG